MRGSPNQGGGAGRDEPDDALRFSPFFPRREWGDERDDALANALADLEIESRETDGGLLIFRLRPKDDDDS